MTGPIDLIGDPARSYVGRELSRRQGLVDRVDFQRWASAVGDRNPLYFDPDTARRHGYRDVIMPLLYLPLSVRGVVDVDRLGPDGLPVSDGVGSIPLPLLPRRMGGGLAYRLHKVVYPGDVLECAESLTSLTQKQGRSGPFVIIERAAVFTRHDGPVGVFTHRMIALPARPPA